MGSPRTNAVIGARDDSSFYGFATVQSSTVAITVHYSSVELSSAVADPLSVITGISSSTGSV